MSEATKENNIRQVDGFDVILRSAMNGVSQKIEHNVTVTDGCELLRPTEDVSFIGSKAYRPDTRPYTPCDGSYL